jgi:hypothetical protein
LHYEWRCSFHGYSTTSGAAVWVFNSTMDGAAICMDIALRVALLFVWI